MSTVGNILDSRNNEVWSVRSQQSVLEAIRVMAEKGIGAVLVIDDNRLSGILSERDYTRKVILENRSSSNTLVRDIMTQDVVTATRNDHVANCMALMTDNDFRHLPVVENKQVIGMISIGDLVKVVIHEQQYTIKQLENYIAG